MTQLTKGNFINFKVTNTVRSIGFRWPFTHFKALITSIILFSSFQGLKAGVIAEYAVSTGTANTATVSSTASNVTATSLTRGSQVVAPGSPCTNGFSSTSSGTGFTSSSLNSNAYISFTVKPNACYSLSLSDLAVGVRSSGTGPTKCQIDYSLDGGSTWTTGKTAFTPSTSSCQTSANTLGNFSFSSGTTAGYINGIIVKIYGWGGSSSAGTFQLYKLDLNGSVNYSPPTPSATGTLSACIGAKLVYRTAKVTGDSYAWTSTGGTVSGSSANDSFVITWGSTGTYSIKVVETNTTGGCQDSSTITVVVNAKPTPAASSSDTNICKGATGTYSTSSVSGDTYKWTTTGGTISSGAGTASITVSWPVSGTFNVKVVETNSSGCKDSSTVKVKVSRPTPSITGDANVCTSSTGTYKTTNNSGDTYVWSSTGGSISAGSGTASITISWPTAGTYTVKVVETNATGCKDSSSFTVKVGNPTPLATGDTIVCAGASGTYKTNNISGDTYKWTSSAGTITTGAGTGTIIINWPSAGTYTVKVVETHTVGGCKDSSTINVRIIGRPTPLITADTIICTNTGGAYKTTSVSGDTYKWTTTGGTITSGAGTEAITINWPTAGTYTVKVVETNANGCKDSNTVIVKVSRPKPVMTADLTVCTGNTGNYKVTNVSGDTYKWSSTSGTISGAGTSAITINWPSAGTYTVKVVETNSSGCKDSSTATVNVSRPTPAVTSADTIICTGTNGTYKTTSTGSDTYKWTATGGTITSGAGTATVNVSWPTAGTYTVKVVETNTNGCKDSSSIPVKVSRPKPVLSGDANVCTGNNGTYKTASVSGDTYNWTTTGGSITSGTGTETIVVKWPTTGTYTVKVVETNIYGCKDSSTYTVKVSRPIPVVTGDSIICTGNTGSYKTASVSGDTYSWTAVGGTITSGTGTANVLIKWPTAGVYSVKVVETNSNGCKDSSTIAVKVNRPTPSVIGDAVVCTGNSGSYKTASASGDTYSWTTIGGTITSGYGTGSITIKWPTAGTYTVKVVETNVYGCKDSSTFTVKVGRPTPVIIGDSIACTGDFIMYKASSVSGDTYNWTTAGGTITYGTGTSAVIVNWPTSGNYKVKLVEINSNGCADSNTLALNVSIPTPGIISNDSILCTGDSGTYRTANNIGSTYTWITSGGNVSTGSSDAMIKIQWPAAGTYLVRVIETNSNGCEDSSSIFVKVSRPTPGIIGNANVCAGSTGTYKTSAVSGDTYKWTSTGGAITGGAGTAAISIYWPDSGTYYVKVVETNASGCKDSSIISVKIGKPSPLVSGDSIICTGTTGTYKTPDISGNTYKWITNGGTISSGSGTGTISINWPAAGTYYVKVIESNAGGCSDSSIMTVKVSRPTPSASGDTIVCTSGTGTYKTTGVSGNTYKWIASGGTITSGATSASATIKWPTSGTFIAKVVETNASGCKDSSTVSVQVSKPTPSISGDAAICTGTSGAYKTAGVSGDTYNWTSTGGSITSGAGTSSIGISWPAAGSYIVKVVETNANGCKDSNTFTVNVSRPTPLLSGDAIICTGTSGAYKTSSVSGNTYKWTTTGGTIASGSGTASISVSWPTAGTYMVKVVETNTSGCKDSSTFTVNVSRPTPLISGDAVICTGTSGAYKTASISGDSYKWTATGGSISSGAGTNAISINWAAAGTYTVKVVETNTNGCKDSNTFSVNVSRPTPSVSGDAVVCTGTNGNYKTSSVSSNTYQWTATGGTVASGSGTASISVNWPTAGSYIVKVVETNTNGCKDSSTFSVNVSRPKPYANGDTVICTGTSGNYKTASATGDTYKWTSTGGSITSGAGTNAISISWPTAGTYTVKVVETNGNGCKDSSTATVIVSRPKPVITVSSSDTIICTGTSGNYKTTNVSGDTYKWTATGGTVSSGAGTASIVVNWPTAGTYKVKVVETNASGCKDSSTVTIKVSRPTPSASGDLNVCTGTSGSYKLSTVSGNTYKWSTTSGTISSGAGTGSITVNWPSSGTYTVKVVETNTSGCKDSSTVTVNVSRPTPVLSGDTIICTGITGAYKAAGASGDSYKWTTTGGTITSGAGSNAITVNWPSAGTFKVKVVETNAFGCKDSSTINVKVSRPTPLIRGDSNVCTATTGIYKITSVSGDTYKWRAVGGTIVSGSGTNTVTVSWPSAGSYNVKVVETNLNGCKDSNIMIVNVGRPSPSLSGDTVVCAASSGSYKTSGALGDSYKWITTGGTVSSGSGTASVVVNWPASGTYQLKLIETNIGGCMDSSIITVKVSKPTPHITGDTLACTGSNGAYKTAKVVGNTYQWIANGGTVNSGASTSSVTVNWPKAGTYSVKVIETNANGCKDSSTAIVKVSKPSPSITGAQSVCSASSLSYAVAAVAGDKYDWTVNGATIASGAGTNAITVNWTKNGSYTVKVVETNSSGCKDSNLITVVVDHPTPSIKGNLNVCTGTIASYKTAGVSGHSYTWIAAGGTIVTGAGTDSITVSWFTAGNYTLKLIESGSTGCKDSNSININISWPAPIVKGDTDACLNTPTTYKTAAVVGDTYQWAISGGTITSGAGTESVTVNWNSAGTRSITVKETNSQSCSANSTLNVNVNTQPNAGWSDLNPSGRTFNFVAGDKSNVSYTWDFGDSNTDTGATVSHTYTANGTYNVKLTVKNKKGCVASYTSMLNVSSSGINTPARQNIGLSVYPNPFTNETNIAYTLDNNAMVSLRIYNMDGRLVQNLDEGLQVAGDHHYVLIGDNKLPAGVYILQMVADKQNIIRRIVRLQ